MNYDRVCAFDEVCVGDVLIYESDPDFQKDAETGMVVDKGDRYFTIAWADTPNIPVNYYRVEDAMGDWMLFKVTE